MTSNTATSITVDFTINSPGRFILYLNYNNNLAELNAPFDAITVVMNINVASVAVSSYFGGKRFNIDGNGFYTGA